MVRPEEAWRSGLCTGALSPSKWEGLSALALAFMSLQMGLRSHALSGLGPRLARVSCVERPALHSLLRPRGSGEDQYFQYVHSSCHAGDPVAEDGERGGRGRPLMLLCPPTAPPRPVPSLCPRPTPHLTTSLRARAFSRQSPLASCSTGKEGQKVLSRKCPGSV